MSALALSASIKFIATVQHVQEITLAAEAAPVGREWRIRHNARVRAVKDVAKG